MKANESRLTDRSTAMASTRIVEEERGTYTGQIRPQHNGYWAGEFSASVPTPSGAPVPDLGGWR